MTIGLMATLITIFLGAAGRDRVRVRGRARGRAPDAHVRLLPRPAHGGPRADPGAGAAGRHRRGCRAVRDPRHAAGHHHRDRHHELGDHRPDHPVAGALDQGADVRGSGAGRGLRIGLDHAAPHPAQRRQPDRGPGRADLRHGGVHRDDPRLHRPRRPVGAVVGPDPQRCAELRGAGSRRRGGTSSRRPPAWCSWCSRSRSSATRSTRSSTRSPEAAGERGDPRAGASGRCPSRPTPVPPCSRSRTSRSASRCATARSRPSTASRSASTTARRWASPASRAAARRPRPSRWSACCPANGRIRGGSVKLFGIDLVPKTERQLARYRWREISIVFQGAMNALNPVQRIGDQIAEPIEVRLGQPRDAVAQAGRRPPGPRGHPEAAGVRLPARALGWHAPAGDDRDGARLRSGDRDRRRAHDRARRHGPGADPPAPGAAPAATSACP